MSVSCAAPAHAVLNGATSLFWPVQRWLDALPDAPASNSLRALTMQYPVILPDGRPVRFVPPQADGMPYECRVWERGEVETRPISGGLLMQQRDHVDAPGDDPATWTLATGEAEIGRAHV